ncbi:MAG: ABC transporter permease [Planctomycetota bacterium]
MRFHQFILKNLTRRKLRTLLTLAGVAIAVAATISLLGVADGFERATSDSLTQRNIDIVVIEETAVDQLSSDVDERVLAQVLAFPEVDELAPSLIDLVGFDAGEGTMVNCLVQGWPPGSPSYRGLEVQAGRLLETGDQEVAMIGEMFAKNLDKTVGDSIEVNGESFEIVGIFRSFIHPENAGVLVTLKEMQRLLLQEGRITGFGVTLKVPGSASTAESVRDKIAELTLPSGKPARLNAMLTQDYVKGSMHLRVARSMAWLTSTIALFVGTIGVLNTMFMSVMERVKEISILRAIGWRKSRVIAMILSESMILTLCGAVLGAFGAAGIVAVLTSFPGVNGLIDGRIAPAVLLWGLLLAILVGVVGGFYPAVRAAALLPSEGLREN